MSTKKILLVAVALVVLVAGVYVYREYTRKNKDLSTVGADLTISSANLITSFENNEADANKKFLDKVIQVEGAVKEVAKDEKGYYTVVLGKTDEMSSVRCSMDSVHQAKAATIEKGAMISVKGICTGFNADELLGSDVILNRCVIVKQ